MIAVYNYLTVSLMYKISSSKIIRFFYSKIPDLTEGIINFRHGKKISNSTSTGQNHLPEFSDLIPLNSSPFINIEAHTQVYANNVAFYCKELIKMSILMQHF